MHRQPFDLVRLFLSLFQDLPPLSRALYIPGAVLLIGYPVLAVSLGPDQTGSAFAGLPLLVLTLADDPLWCQRMQSAFYIIIGGIFLSDVLKDRNDTAASFWPDVEMRAHLPNLSRMMVVYNFGFLLLNETLIQAVDPSHWLVFWAVLPIIGHTVLRAMVLTVINLDDDGHTV